MGRMRQLYRPRTEEQLRIMAWLLEQGITREDIAWVALTAPNRVSIGKRSGQCLEVTYEEGAVRVCTNEEGIGSVDEQRKGRGRPRAGHRAAH